MGCVFASDPTRSPWMVFEYMSLGDLANLLRSRAPPILSAVKSFSAKPQSPQQTPTKVDSIFDSDGSLCPMNDIFAFTGTVGSSEASTARLDNESDVLKMEGEENQVNLKDFTQNPNEDDKCSPKAAETFDHLHQKFESTRLETTEDNNNKSEKKQRSPFSQVSFDNECTQCSPRVKYQLFRCLRSLPSIEL